MICREKAFESAVARLDQIPGSEVLNASQSDALQESEGRSCPLLLNVNSNTHFVVAVVRLGQVATTRRVAINGVARTAGNPHHDWRIQNQLLTGNSYPSITTISQNPQPIEGRYPYAL